MCLLLIVKYWPNHSNVKIHPPHTHVSIRLGWSGRRGSGCLSGCRLLIRFGLAFGESSSIFCFPPSSSYLLLLLHPLTRTISLGHHRHAAALKKAFSISEKRFYWLKVLTLCEERNWEELDAFASERKSPIGWEPFLQLAKSNVAPREVQSR